MLENILTPHGNQPRAAESTTDRESASQSRIPLTRSTNSTAHTVAPRFAPYTNDVTFFSTFATNLVHAMSEIYRDICLQMQRHSRHVVTFAYLPVGR